MGEILQGIDNRVGLWQHHHIWGIAADAQQTRYLQPSFGDPSFAETTEVKMGAKMGPFHSLYLCGTETVDTKLIDCCISAGRYQLAG